MWGSKFKPDPVIFRQAQGGYVSGMHSSDHYLHDKLEFSLSIKTQDKKDSLRTCS